MKLNHKMTKFILPIGDWSGDGHSKYKEYTLQCNCSLEELREKYFQTIENVGIGLDSNHKGPCSEYEEYTITSEQLGDLALVPNKGMYYDEDEDSYSFDKIGFVQLFIDYMKKYNPELEIEIIGEPKLPMFPFYGYDEKKRHIGYFGYGLFD